MESNRSIYIGWDPREQVAFEIARHSLLRRLSEPIPVHALRMGDLEERGLYTRPTSRKNGRLIDELSIRENYDGSISTEHANARFFVPHLAKTGWAVFMDGDMLVQTDMAELFDLLEPEYAVYCVKHEHVPHGTVKMDSQVQTRYHRKNWSSFMAFNCDHPSTKKLTMFMLNNWPGRDLHAFSWLDDHEIGSLSQRWNFLVGYTDKSRLLGPPKVIHYTEGVPDMPGYENCEFADEWRAEQQHWEFVSV